MANRIKNYTGYRMDLIVYSIGWGKIQDKNRLFFKLYRIFCKTIQDILQNYAGYFAILYRIFCNPIQDILQRHMGHQLQDG